ncbi:MAG TPA: GNAT family N-acetyltransferase, partial [Acidobacteriota bacterium]|nr:GNAT family N-acetyltransferase [Acidobacteriota bacterium]
GSISLVEQAVAGRSDLTPCLTALFVLPEHRHRGVATQLLDAAFTQAKAQGAERVFFAVPEQEDFFARRGWQVHEPALGAQALVVLSKQ